jgi:hypothetical protein
MSSILKIYIMTHNRNNLLYELLSKLPHTLISRDLIVISDNSGDPAKVSDIRNSFPSIPIVERSHCTAQDHFIQIVSEATTNYCMILHDDDIILPNIIEDVLGSIERFPGYAAYGFNAYLLFGDHPTNELYYKASCKYHEALSLELIKQSFSIFTGSHPPFPAYCYSTKFLREFFDSSSISTNKHDDLLLLIYMALRGKLLWISTPIIYYRIHELSDTAKECLYSRLGIVRKVIVKQPKSAFYISEISQYLFYASARSLASITNLRNLSRIVTLSISIFIFLLSLFVIIFANPIITMTILRKIFLRKIF